MTADLTAMEKEEVDRKTSHQGPLSVLTKIIEEKTVRQGSFAVEVEKMKSDLAEAERTLVADKARSGLPNRLAVAGSWLVRGMTARG